MSQILVEESFLIGSMFVSNFMKIERGPNFFLLIWYGMTLTSETRTAKQFRKTKSYKNQSQIHLNKIKPAVI